MTRILLAAFGVIVVAVLTTFSFKSVPASLADEPKKDSPRVVLAEMWNGVTKIYFTNVAVHKGSPEPNPVKRRFRADVRYWLMDAKTYEKGELGIGNPELTEFVRKMGKKSLPASEPTTLPVLAHGIAASVLKEYPLIKKIEVQLTHFSKGLTADDEGEDNHVVTIVLER
ncbi:MAG: hypothetical protein K8U57_13025 [Planctomycetes bacterium]|nr:hypothetical protein [Planctomycetota bacterium]